MSTAIYDENGIALLAVVILILIAAIAIAGIAGFVSNSLALNTARAAMEEALFAAQAGVFYALNDYRAIPLQPYWVKYRSVNILGNIDYSVGTDANFLAVNASNPQVRNGGGPRNNMLRNIPLSNINDNQAITADRVKLEWDFGGHLNRIVLGHANPESWSGSVATGTIVTLTRPFTLAARRSFSNPADNTWRFTQSIPADAIILVTFYFTDGSSRKAYLMNNGRSGNDEFSITATGITRGTTNWRRSVEATYDAGTGKITSWKEVEGHI